jgi:chondroitin 4-sulfotransferase 11
MINHKHKFLFVHIPRTGGTSIEKNFPNYTEKRKHWTLNGLKEILDLEIFDEYFKFSFVRNPWDFIISKYKDVWFTSEHPGGPIGELAGKSLKYFLEHYKTPSHEKGETFHDYFDPEQMDFVGRFENRENDLEYISEKIGFTIDSKIHQRKIQMRDKNKKHYTEYYDDETREIIAEKYAKDIEYFGYKFGE